MSEIENTSETSETPDAPTKPVTLEIYLKGGQTFKIEVTKWSLAKGVGLNRLSWTMADDSTMPYLDLSEVAAVIERVSP